MDRSYRITPFGAVVGTRSELVEAAGQILDALTLATPHTEAPAPVAARRPRIEDLLRVVAMSYDELEMQSA